MCDKIDILYSHSGISTIGKNYTSHFRPDTMVTGSSPSLLDLTVTYDYTTDVTSVDSNAPRPSIQQLTQLFPFQVREREGGRGRGRERERESDRERESVCVFWKGG